MLMALPQNLPSAFMKVRSIFRRRRFHNLFYFLSRTVSRIPSARTNCARGIPGPMADLPGNIPRSMTDFFGDIAGRVANRSTSFFKLCASRQDTTKSQR